MILLVLCSVLIRQSFAQEQVVAKPLSHPSPDDPLQAYTLTRFHFITLRQFHGSLFSPLGGKHALSDLEARLLNAGLNQFLTQANREMMLLEALRQGGAILLRFTLGEEGEEDHVSRSAQESLLDPGPPEVQTMPLELEIQPLLDRPVAFEVRLLMGDVCYFYDVDWWGNISRTHSSSTAPLLEDELSLLESTWREVAQSA